MADMMENEVKSLREHCVKHYRKPDGSMVCVVSSGLLHYHDGEKFQELPDVKFPEGKVLQEKKDSHFVMDLPEWGEPRLENDGKTIRVYDKRNVPIFIFNNPYIVSKGVEALEEDVDSFGPKERKVRKKGVGEDCRFEVKDKKIYVKPPKKLEKSEYPLQVYDDTDTSATNEMDAHISHAEPNTNYSGAYNFTFRGSSAADFERRPLIKWTLPDVLGSIEKIESFHYARPTSQDTVDIEVHELTGGFVEDEVTWNKRNSSTSWSTAGGDYNATVIDSATWDDNGVWNSVVLQGSGATNPLSLSFGDSVSLLFKLQDESVGISGHESYTKENADHHPYLEITYTPTSPFPTFFRQ